MYAKAINYRGSIVIYYKHDKKDIRLSTYVTNIPKDEKCFKNGMVTAKMADHEKKNEEIYVKLNQVNDIIKDFFFANKYMPSVEFVKSELYSTRYKFPHYDFQKIGI